MITLLPRPFSTGDTPIQEMCNNGSIVAHSFRVDNMSDINIIYYTSRLYVKINPSIAGKNVTCLFEEGILSPINIGSITVTQKGNYYCARSCMKLTPLLLVNNIKTAQFISSEVEYSEVNTKLGSRTIIISFSWNHFNISMCPAIPYNILTSNCGSCPTTTNHTNATCTDVPADVTYCSFALIPTICGGISPNLSILLDVKLNGIPD
jgi:hypothetical protein